ncbi:hypothetical protein [Rummeliibacillus pycnus]|nr:hypothetical protein [Rummeliibacillus pycnus]
MEENKFASLSEEKLKELKDLEEKFGYTLIAYETGNFKGNQPGINETSSL